MDKTDLKRIIIQRAIQSKNMTISDFAFEIGYARSYLSAIINGSRKANDYILEHIANALGISFSELFHTYKDYQEHWHRCFSSMLEWNLENSWKEYRLLKNKGYQNSQLILVDPEIPHHYILAETFLAIHKKERIDTENLNTEPLLLAQCLQSYRKQDWKRLQENLEKWKEIGISEENKGIFSLFKAVLLYYQRKVFSAYEHLLKAQHFFLQHTHVYLLKLSFLLQASIYTYFKRFEEARKIFIKLEKSNLNKEHQAICVQKHFLNLLLQNKLTEAENKMKLHPDSLAQYAWLFNREKKTKNEILEKDFMLFIDVIDKNKICERFEEGIINVQCPLLERFIRLSLIEHYQKQRKYKAVSKLQNRV